MANGLEMINGLWIRADQQITDHSRPGGNLKVSRTSSLAVRPSCSKVALHCHLRRCGSLASCGKLLLQWQVALHRHLRIRARHLRIRARPQMTKRRKMAQRHQLTNRLKMARRHQMTKRQKMTNRRQMPKRQQMAQRPQMTKRQQMAQRHQMTNRHQMTKKGTR